jgi:3-deoxy-D-manno-octulosonic acid (KDO) 8-phosphate synthase
MKPIADKVFSVGSPCYGRARHSFGYRDLVVDTACDIEEFIFPSLTALGAEAGASGGTSGATQIYHSAGQSGVAVGVDGIFVKRIPTQQCFPTKCQLPTGS